MTNVRIIKAVTGPEPTLAAHLTTKNYVDTGFLPVSARGIAGGVAPLDSGVLVPIAYLPVAGPGDLPGTVGNSNDAGTSNLLARSDHTHNGVPTSAKGAAGGVATLDGSTKIPIAQIPTGATASTVVIGNDTRLSDARTPLAHNSTHFSGGSDPLTPANIGAVANSGSETVAGVKTFSSSPVVPTPSGGTDAANKTYVDSALATASAGVVWKQPVRVATTANISLSGTQTIDGVAVTAGQRVLVKNQTTTSQNGLYVVAAGAWARATDADSAAELEGGVVVSVDEGAANANTMWMLSADVATLGTDPVTWTQFGAPSVYTASLGVQLVGSDFRANLGTGLTLSGNQIVPDYTGSNVMKRKVATGVVGTTGADITITHSFALANKEDIVVQVWESGVLVQVGVTAVDVNSVTLSFAATPTSNQYRYSMLGLS